MKNSINYRSYATLAGLVVTALMTGCQHNTPAHGEVFYKDGAPTSTGNFAQAECAAGAKEDGMLYDVNFHGTELNALGQGKLDLMVKAATPGEPLLVYLSMPHDLVAARQASVTEFLKNRGMTDSAIIVAEGANSNLNTPTAYNISGVYKIDNNTPNGQAAVDTGTGGAAGLSVGH